MVARSLDVVPADIRLVLGDSRVTESVGPTSASRGTGCGGGPFSPFHRLLRVSKVVAFQDNILAAGALDAHKGAYVIERP